MQINGYSQLPVTTNKTKGLIGYISWETIARAKINGVESKIVKDYVDRNIFTLSPDEPLISAVKTVKEHDFAIILAKDQSLLGIVTVSDITQQFIEDTEPFVLLNELENHIRNLMKDKILLEDMKKLCQNDKEITCIDDLDFGDYISVLGNDAQWNKLNVSADRKLFIDKLDTIRKIRNEIVHFRSQGIDEDKKCQIRNVVNYLRQLVGYQQKNAWSLLNDANSLS